MGHYKLQLFIALIALGCILNATRDKCMSNWWAFTGIGIILLDCLYITIIERINRKP